MSTAPVVKIGGTGAAAGTHTTASYTPQANSMEVAYVSAFKTTAGVALPTISDTAGNTWTQLASFETTTASNPNIRGVWFISADTGGAPSARTVTVASTGASAMGVVIADVLTVDVSGSLAQAAVGAEDLANGDPSCAFGSTPGATNITLLGASFGGGNAATKPASFTSIASASNATSRWNAASYDITSASIGPNQYTSGNIRSIILGIELAPAGSSNKTLAAAGGSYALTGAPATLRRNLPLVAGTASYSLTGAAAGLLRVWKVVADTAAYSLTGSAALLAAGKSVAAGAGSYLLAGAVANLRHGFAILANGGNYALAGSSATLRASKRVAANPGSYVLTGAPVGLLLTSKKLAADAGVYVLTGGVATLSAGADNNGGGNWLIRARRRGIK